MRLGRKNNGIIKPGTFMFHKGMMIEVLTLKNRKENKADQRKVKGTIYRLEVIPVNNL